MKKEIIGKILVVLAMSCLTFIFAALSVHYDVFAVGFRDGPVNWGEMLLMLGVVAFVGIIGIGFSCMVSPQCSGLFLLPFAVWDNITEKHGKWQHLFNVFLVALCVAFVLYACNLVLILEHLSGEQYRHMPTFSGFLAVLYVWVIFFGTLFVFGWLSGLTEAIGKFFNTMAEAERTYREDLQKKSEKQQKQRTAKKKITYTKL